MKIIDTFLFYNEEKLLDFRLNYYKNTVDYFVIVEATKTFSGVEKPLYFNNIKHKYSHFNNIIHVIIDDMPSSITINFDNSIIAPSTNWEREFYQRNYIKKALKDIPNISDEDWIMINDVDEFPNRDKLYTVQNNDLFSSPDKIGYTLEFDMYYYNLTSKLNHKWYKVKLLRYHVVKNIDLNTARDSLFYPTLIEFGWHFSYFFTPDMIKNKIQAFSHQEYNDEKYTNKYHVEDCIKNGKSLFHLDSTRTEFIIHTPIETNPNLPEGYELIHYDKKLKLALVFSGQPRFYNSKSYKSIKEKIMDIYDCDVYCHFWWDGKGEGEYIPSPWNKLDPIKMDKNVESDLKKMYNPISIKYDLPLDNEDIDNNRYRPHQPSSGYNIRSMYTSMSRAHDLYKQFKIKDYDFIVRLRYDIFIENFPDLNLYTSNDLILSNSRDNRTDVIANEIWVCKPEISEYLFNINDYSTTYNKHGIIWNDEELFNSHVRDKFKSIFIDNFKTHIPTKNGKNPHF